MSDKPKLTRKQAVFVKQYLIDLNATQAAIRSGYSKKTARQIGTENLDKPAIKAAIEEANTKLLKSLDITAERTLRERARLAYYDIGALASAGLAGPADIANLPDEVRQAVVGWKWDKDGRFVLEFADKNPSLAALERHLGLYEKDNAQKGDPFGMMLERVMGTGFKPVP